jgi:DICT domain-containing protein
MSTGAGAGYNVPDIDVTLADFVNQAAVLHSKLVRYRAWFDRISTGTDQQAADALVAKVAADGGTLSGPKALLIIQAMREVTYWGGLYAPTYCLDVSGPPRTT